MNFIPHNRGPVLYVCVLCQPRIIETREATENIKDALSRSKNGSAGGGSHGEGARGLHATLLKMYGHRSKRNPLSLTKRFS